MTTTYNPGIHRFAKFVVAWTVLLFIAGALVTSNNAALSVPDWPKSFGTWFPSLRQLAGGAFFEHSHSVIAGGSVVTKNIPPYSVAVGNPARVIKRYDFEKAEWVKV